MRYILVAGSNCEERYRHIQKALTFLDSIGKIERRSEIYETPDCLGTGTEYLNVVLEFETVLAEESLKKIIKEFELSCGRISLPDKIGPVSLDIDIVISNGKVKRPKDFSASYFRKGYETILKDVSMQNHG